MTGRGEINKKEFHLRIDGVIGTLTVTIGGSLDRWLRSGIISIISDVLDG
jgi:hypothetical protein